MTNINTDMTLPLPFGSYPESGLKFIGIGNSGGCRSAYGLDFMKRTGQTCCAYCRLDFTEQYNYWVLMTLDHVVTKKICKEHPNWYKDMNLSNYNVFATKTRTMTENNWFNDFCNRVLACSACNGFDNRYEPNNNDIIQLLEKKCFSVDDFFALRDMIFKERYKKIQHNRNEEINIFKTKPWLQPV